MAVADGVKAEAPGFFEAGLYQIWCDCAQEFLAGLVNGSGVKCHRLGIQYGQGRIEMIKIGVDDVQTDNFTIKIFF